MGGIPIEGTPNPAAVLGYRYPSYYDLGWQARERYPQLSCCSADGPRGLGCLSEWAVMRASDAIVINYYGPSTATLAAPNGTQVTLVQQTAYPVDGAIRITVTPSQAAAFVIRLRIPEWSVANRLDVNGNVQPCAAGSYAELRRVWQPGDVITLALDMSIRVVAGLEAAWGYAVAYRGPLLLAYDTRLGTFDPLAMPAIDLKSPRQVRPGAEDAVLLVSFPSSSGEITFCDFASASQAPPLSTRPDTVVVWQFSRSDGSVIAEQMRLLGDGTLQGHSHPNEARWGFEGDTLTFFTSGGVPSTRFTARVLEHGKQVLSGLSLLDSKVRHLLSEVDLAISNKTWQFWRQTPDKRILLSTVRLLANGAFDVPTNPNETRWGMEGDVLVFFDAHGAASTRFTSVRMRNGRVERSGPFLPDTRIRHVLSEVDLDITSKLWLFNRKGGDTLVDKVRLLPNHGLDGYHDDNEASWIPGTTRDTLAFRSKSGAISTSFDTFSAVDGVMSLEGRFAFDPSACLTISLVSL
jgi:Beta-L-arabinofuranosidase, GH127